MRCERPKWATRPERNREQQKLLRVLRTATRNYSWPWSLRGQETASKRRKLSDALSQDFPLDTTVQNYSVPTIRAAMKLRENDPAAAVEILRPTVKYELADSRSFCTLYPAYIRGLAYLRMGEGRLAAVRVPEAARSSGHRGKRSDWGISTFAAS